MSFLTKLSKVVVPTAIGFATGGPAGAFVAGVSASEQQKAERQFKQAQQRQTQEINTMVDFGLDAYGTSPTARNTVPATQNAGFFDRLSSFGSRVGTSSLNLLENVLPGVITGKLLGTGTISSGQQPAVSTTLNVGAQESSGSGSIQAGLGSALPSLVNFGSRLLRSPGGQLGIGTAVGGALSLMGPDGRQMRITRKMKSQARMVLNLTGGNISAAADILGVDDNTLVMILLKRFRNDGPVITKAALRKTRQTMRRLKSMCDMQSDLLPRTTRRRAPMKRATTTTLIKN